MGTGDWAIAILTGICGLLGVIILFVLEEIGTALLRELGHIRSDLSKGLEEIEKHLFAIRNEAHEARRMDRE